jgi:hypothetical protein
MQSCGETYQSTLFPDPANHKRDYQNSERHEGDIRTQTMDPHQRSCRFPIIHGIALRKPRGRATVMRSPGDIVVYPWIRSRQPAANVLLQPVTYDVVSAYISQKWQYQHVTNVRAGLLELPVPASGLAGKVNAMFDYTSQPDIPRVFWISSIVALPSTRSCLVSRSQSMNWPCAPSITTCMLLTRP